MKCRWTTAVLLLLIAPAFAQTDSRMVNEPWPDQTWGQTHDKLIFEAAADSTNNTGGAQVFWWDSIGRFRFSKTDPDAFTPGYRLFTTNLDTKSPSLPDELNKFSLAGRMQLAASGDGKVKLTGGLGYNVAQ